MNKQLVHFHESGGWLVYGEHTKESAVARLNELTATPADQEEYGIYPDDTWTEPFNVETFRSFDPGWWRWVPAPRLDENYAYYLHDAKPHSRGAFQAAGLYY
jgi:hypothetical protein